MILQQSGPAFLSVSSTVDTLHRTLGNSELEKLHNAIISTEDDSFIWELIFSLIESKSEPQILVPANNVQNTPHRRNADILTAAALESGKSQITHADIDPYLCEELDGHIFYDSKDFFDIFFLAKACVSQLLQEAITSGIYTPDKGWAQWPAPSHQNNVLRFVYSATESKLTGVKPRYTYGTSCTSVIVGKDNQKLYPDIVVTPSHSNEFNISHCLANTDSNADSNVRVIGELKANNKISNHADVILQTARYVRQIFQSQHSRVFVHAFTLCGDLLRAWIFDRSGGLGSQLISINKEPELFLRVFCGYATMDAKDTGFDPTIRKSTSDTSYSTLDSSDSKKTKMFLKPQAIFSSRAIVSRGTVIWAGRTNDTPCADWDYAIKDQWRHTDRVPEAAHLQAAREAGVMNVANYIYDEELGSISAIVQRGLHSGNCKGTKQNQGSLTTSTGSTSHSSKRRSDSLSAEPRRSKRLKSQISGPIMPPPPFPKPDTTRQPTYTAQLSTRKSTAARQSASGPQSRVLAHKVGITTLGSKDRERSRLVISPLGKDLTKFQSFTGLLLVFRGAIKGHRALYQKAHILHRDISINNVLIDQITGDGFLVDLDLAINPRRPTASGAPHRIGTFDFMAIGVHYGHLHTYRHDLESFFWLLLYLCIYCPGPDNDPLTSRAKLKVHGLQETLFQTIAKLRDNIAAVLKERAVGKREFREATIAQTHPHMREMFGELLMNWRDILFPMDIKLEETFIGTPDDENDLYDCILAALEQQIPAVKMKEDNLRGWD
ncbi:hypothetical protein EV426DRAFT_540159 [Tirmania nivea]|nr:hypothetical protein EV426DRAFT_540159 [Tirmania nivea]